MTHSDELPTETAPAQPEVRLTAGGEASGEVASVTDNNENGKIKHERNNTISIRCDETFILDGFLKRALNIKMRL